jgi:hypothetical protein
MLHRPSTGHFRSRRKRIRRSLRSLLTPEQMNHAIHRESLRVDRNGDSSLVLVLFRLRGEHTSSSSIRLAKIVLNRMRISDDVGWFDDQHLGLLLPETSTAGAWRLAQHICDRVARRAPRPHVVMYTYPGSSIEAQGRASVIRQTERPIPKARAG